MSLEIKAGLGVCLEWEADAAPEIDHILIVSNGPQDDDLRILVDGQVVSDTRLNVQWYNDLAQVFFPPGLGTQNSAYTTAGFRQIYLPGTVVRAGSLVQVDVFDGWGAGWVTSTWTATIFWTDGTTTVKTGGANTSGSSPSGSTGGNYYNAGPRFLSYHSNGSFVAARQALGPQPVFVQRRPHSDIAESAGSSAVPTVRIVLTTDTTVDNDIQMTVDERPIGALKRLSSVSDRDGFLERITFSGTLPRFATIQVNVLSYGTEHYTMSPWVAEVTSEGQTTTYSGGRNVKRLRTGGRRIFDNGSFTLSLPAPPPSASSWTTIATVAPPKHHYVDLTGSGDYDYRVITVTGGEASERLRVTLADPSLPGCWPPQVIWKCGDETLDTGGGGDGGTGGGADGGTGGGGDGGGGAEGGDGDTGGPPEDNPVLTQVGVTWKRIKPLAKEGRWVRFKPWPPSRKLTYSAGRGTVRAVAVNEGMLAITRFEFGIAEFRDSGWVLCV